MKVRHGIKITETQIGGDARDDELNEEALDQITRAAAGLINNIRAVGGLLAD